MKVYVILEWREEDFGGYHLAFHSVTSDPVKAEGYRRDDDDYVVEEWEV